MLKKELEEQKIELQNQASKLLRQDEDLRKEFAKAFNWGERKGNLYDFKGEWEWDNPTWEQIFVEVGKLLSGERYSDYEKRLSGIEMRLEEIFRKEEEKRKKK